MKIRDPKIDAFLDDIIGVCKKHELSIAHEDGHGAFLVEKFSEANTKWLFEAIDETIRPMTKAGTAPMPTDVSQEEGDPLAGPDGWHGPGWVRLTPMDRAGRRAVWFRAKATGNELPTELEIRAGREGDDAHVVLRPGDVITPKLLWEIVDAFERGREWVEEGS